MTGTVTRPFTAASFQQFISEGKLMGARCTACEAVYLPPRTICPRCHGDISEWIPLSGEGKLAAFTSIYIAPTFMIEQGYSRNEPYLTGIVTVEEGPQISARILGLDPTNPQVSWIGTPVVVEFLQRGEGDQKKTDLAFRSTYAPI
jgi:uncharacterized OB-fold protein